MSTPAFPEGHILSQSESLSGPGGGRWDTEGTNPTSHQALQLLPDKSPSVCLHIPPTMGTSLPSHGGDSDPCEKYPGMLGQLNTSYSKLCPPWPQAALQSGCSD